MASSYGLKIGAAFWPRFLCHFLHARKIPKGNYQTLARSDATHSESMGHAPFMETLQMMKTNSFKLSLLAGLFWLMAGNASTEIPAMVEDMDSIQVTVRTNPLKPEEERFADDWHIQVHAMDDEGNVASPTYYGRTDHTGDATVAVPKYMYSQPLMMDAFNIVWPYTGLGQGYQIFIPPYCSDKALWLIAPFEDALWRYYKDAAARKGEAWNPSQVDCATWLNNLQLLSLTHEVNEELETKSLFAPFAREVLVRAFQNNHHLLVPTRAPICLAEWRHDGGDMTKGQPITTSSTQTHIALDDKTWLPSELNAAKDEDPILVDSRSGTVDQICRGQVAASSQIQVNGASVMPHEHHWLAEDDFLGTIHEQKSALPNLDVTVFNTRHSNGRPKGDSLYDDSCAVTSVVRFTNNDTSDYELDRGTGVYLYGLFGDGRRSEVHLTSDGDTIVDDDDQWVIFKNYNDDGLRVLVVELLGQRQGDFADGLRMIYHPEPDNLFIGLNTKRELNESGLFGNSGYLKYTIHRYDNTDWEGFMTTFKDFANCYESADAWTKQYFNTAGYPGALEV